jgi:O-acetyl-ADP-ribose deacetylase (regulator of RNase III)
VDERRVADDLRGVIEIVRGDITALDVDAIVNAANSTLLGGGGVDGAIHRAAGPELARASGPLGPCPPGEAVITPGFRLRARFVIHAVGPIWSGGTHGEPAILRRAYEHVFRIARETPGIRSIAFPAISTGAYGFPKDRAARIALSVMLDNEPHFERIVACLFDVESELLYIRTLAELRAANGV